MRISGKICRFSNEFLHSIVATMENTSNKK